MKKIARAIGYLTSVIFILWVMRAIWITLERDDGEFGLMTYGNTVIVLMCIASLFLPYEKMRFLLPISVSLSGIYFLVLCAMIDMYTTVTWFIVGHSFIFAMVIFLMFFLGREKIR